MSTKTDALDAALLRLALRQAGVFHRRQLLLLGFAARMIDRRIAGGAWLRLAPSTYSLVGYPNTWERAQWIAVLAHPDAVLSGRAAARLYGLTGFGECRPDITVPRGTNHHIALANVHQSDLSHHPPPKHPRRLRPGCSSSLSAQ